MLGDDVINIIIINLIKVCKRGYKNYNDNIIIIIEGFYEYNIELIIIDIKLSKPFAIILFNIIKDRNNSLIFS